MALIKNGANVAVGGFVGCAHLEEITAEMEKSFLDKQVPRDLTLVYAADLGDNKDKGLNHLGYHLVKPLTKHIVEMLKYK